MPSNPQTNDDKQEQDSQAGQPNTRGEGAQSSPIRLGQWIQMTAQEHPYGFIGAVAGASLLTNWLMRRHKVVGAGMAVMTLASLFVKRRVEAKETVPPAE